MGEMFRACSSLKTIDLSGWNTSSVINGKWEGTGSGIYYTFGNDTSGFEGMCQMFKDCKGLEHVYVGSGWNTAGKHITNMFTGANISAVSQK